MGDVVVMGKGRKGARKGRGIIWADVAVKGRGDPPLANSGNCKVFIAVSHHRIYQSRLPSITIMLINIY